MLKDLQFRPVKKAAVLFKPLDDGAVLFEPETELVHTLNPSAAFIWVHCDGAFAIRDIIELIKKNFTDFELDPEKAVVDIINQFQSLDLLQH
ncbi:MAG: PqqD family peptide modification chaperone [Candidatus Marinimicrobia bacterium]|nr:PqqD family peptide modification chaperone [Candidatus Neomarinimicrobiota bacterium]